MIKAIKKQDDGTFLVSLEVTKAQLTAIRAVMESREQTARKCERCSGDGLAHGADRPFEWHGPGTYPGPCPVCGGSGKQTQTARKPNEGDDAKL
jgi:DnaJ-class molecular chaperone